MQAVIGLGARPAPRRMVVLAYIREHPGSSNREIAVGSGISDQGQVSRLLRRAEDLGLIITYSVPRSGLPHAWYLTDCGTLALEQGQATSLARRAPR